MQQIKENYVIKPTDFVTVTKMNHITEVQYLKNHTPPGTCPIAKLDADRYLVKGTGEIKEYKHTKNRSEGVDSLRRTMKNLRYLINNNFTGAQNELFLTLTYAENMQDEKRLYKDVDVFIKRLKRYYAGKEIKYITVAEPQARGAWHLHILLKVKGHRGRLFLSNNDVLAPMWGHGFTKIKSLRRNVDNVGAYLTTYLTDLEIPDTAENAEVGVLKEVEENGEKVSKRVVKGGRLHFYPVGFNFYRTSRNCKKPTRVKMTYEQVLKGALGAKVMEKSIYIIDDTVGESDVKYNSEYGGKIINIVKIVQYNALREGG